MKANIIIYTSLKNDSVYTNQDKELFYHFTTDKDSIGELQKRNPLIEFINESDINNIIKKEEFRNNFKPEKLYECFGKEMISFSENLYKKFKIKTKEDILNIKELISKNSNPEIVSVEFHRMKSTFATFGLEYSRNLIEKKQKKNGIYTIKDICQVENSFESDTLALDNFYQNIEDH